MEITVNVKTVYGVEQIYPVCPKAQAFAAIAGTKTLTRQTLKQVKALGYQIRVGQMNAFAIALAVN